MGIVLTINNNDLRDIIKKKGDNESKFNQKIVNKIFTEVILSDDPLIIEMLPKVRLNTHLIYFNMKEKLEKLGYKKDIDFKIEVKS